MAPKKEAKETKAEGATATPKASKVSKQRAAAKSAPTHGTYQSMITDAIIAFKQRGGSSRQKLKLYVKANNGLETVGDATFTSLFNRAIAQGVEKGVFQLPKGPSGPIKLAMKVPAEKEVKATKEKAAPKEKVKEKKAPAEKKKTIPKEKKVAAPASEKKKAAPKTAGSAVAKTKKAVAAKDATSKVKTGRVTKTSATKEAAAPKEKAAPKKKATPKKKAAPKNESEAAAET